MHSRWGGAVAGVLVIATIVLLGRVLLAHAAAHPFHLPAPSISFSASGR